MSWLSWSFVRPSVHLIDHLVCLIERLVQLIECLVHPMPYRGRVVGSSLKNLV